MRKDAFTVHGTFVISNWDGYVIEISPCGSSARVASDFGAGLQHVGRWQEIKYAGSGDPYVNYRGRRLHLANFVRT